MIKYRPFFLKKKNYVFLRYLLREAIPLMKISILLIFIFGFAYRFWGNLGHGGIVDKEVNNSFKKFAYEFCRENKGIMVNKSDLNQYFTCRIKTGKKILDLNDGSFYSHMITIINDGSLGREFIGYEKGKVDVTLQLEKLNHLEVQDIQKSPGGLDETLDRKYQATFTTSVALEVVEKDDKIRNKKFKVGIFFLKFLLFFKNNKPSFIQIGEGENYFISSKSLLKKINESFCSITQNLTWNNPSSNFLMETFHLLDGGNSLRRSLYFSSITFFTIGYGDFVPLDDFTRILVSLEGFIGILFFGISSAFMYDKIDKYRKNEILKKING